MILAALKSRKLVLHSKNYLIHVSQWSQINTLDQHAMYEVRSGHSTQVWDTRHLDTNMQQEVVFEDSLDRFQQVRPKRKTVLQVWLEGLKNLRQIGIFHHPCQYLHSTAIKRKELYNNNKLPSICNVDKIGSIRFHYLHIIKSHQLVYFQCMT